MAEKIKGKRNYKYKVGHSSMIPFKDILQILHFSMSKSFKYNLILFVLHLENGYQT